MKNIKFLTIILAAIAIITALELNTGCKKKTDPTPAPAANNNNNNNTGCGSGLLCATINSTSFTSGAYNSSGNWTQYNQGGMSQLIYGGYNQVTFDGDKISTQDRFNLAIISPSVAAFKAGNSYSTTSTSGYGLSLSYYKFDPVSLSEFHWATDASHTGNLTLTKFDTIANLASGTFSFYGKEKNINTTGDTSTVHITAGSFTDLKITR
jgi:hypothetical protein